MRNIPTHHKPHSVLTTSAARVAGSLAAIGMAVFMLVGTSAPSVLVDSRQAPHCESESTLSWSQPERLTQPSAATAASVATSTTSQVAQRPCEAAFDWPVAEPQVVRPFEAPQTAWSSGHRGVDLAAPPETQLLAPSSGTITFAGQVAGKSVVSIRHAKTISSFEPAQTDLPVGTAIRKGESFAVVQGGSDHCSDTCVHWGVRSGDDQYIDPAALVAKSRIVLKPT